MPGPTAETGQLWQWRRARLGQPDHSCCCYHKRGGREEEKEVLALLNGLDPTTWLEFASLSQEEREREIGRRRESVQARQGKAGFEGWMGCKLRVMSERSPLSRPVCLPQDGLMGVRSESSEPPFAVIWPDLWGLALSVE